MVVWCEIWRRLQFLRNTWASCAFGFIMDRWRAGQEQQVCVTDMFECFQHSFPLSLAWPCYVMLRSSHKTRKCLLSLTQNASQIQSFLISAFPLVINSILVFIGFFFLSFVQSLFTNIWHIVIIFLNSNSFFNLG